MSVKVLANVLGHFHPESEVADRLVLIVLADAAHDDGITWISQEDIAERARLSERHVRRCLKELDDRREVELRKAQRGRRRINVYRVAVAPEDPVYDRLPFNLVEPFTPKGLLTGPLTGPIKGAEAENDLRCPVVDAPDVRSSPTTTGQEVRSSTPAEMSPPTLVKMDGRNLPFDALAEEAGIVEDDPRTGEVVAALNGPQGIRALFWGECLRYVQQRAGNVEEAVELGHRLQVLHRNEDGVFERALERAIRAKAEKYRLAMAGALLTPGALRKWWISVEQMQSKVAGLTPEEIRRMGEVLS